MEERLQTKISEITKEILEDYRQGRAVDKMDLFDLPDKNEIIDITHELLRLIFPGYRWDKTYKFYNMDNSLSVLIEDIAYRLNKQIAIVLKLDTSRHFESEEDVKKESEKIVIEYLRAIPSIRALADTDLEALYQGDPAAFSKDEVVFSYPGLYAIELYRLAHQLTKLNVPLIPRIMTEQAHSATGIDIHPGATIGEYFFIDHGTGIVIGETTIIGNHVKLYQGVTLGGISTRGGQRLRNVRRHPTICDNVTIYSGASILGGDTIIGEGCVVGGNVFITNSLPPQTKVSVPNQELIISTGKKKVVTVDSEESSNW